MYKAYIEYCIDGYNDIKKEITDLEQQLNNIKEGFEAREKARF